MGFGPIQATHTLAKDQRNAMRMAKAKQDGENFSQATLQVSDEPLVQPYYIYIYNILDRDWYVEQPPLFPGFKIPRCPKGKLVSWNKLGAFLLEPYNKPGTFETYYKKIDGRKVATSLLNPSAFPGIAWESQLQNWDAEDQVGNNLNAYGVFWSLTRPEELEKLQYEVKIFKERANRTLNELIRLGELFAAQGDLKMISPLMHFAMDYYGKEAAWHMSSQHKVTCPNCGDLVVEGIAYHRNSFGEKCVIDPLRYKDMLKMQRQMEMEAASEDLPAPAPVPSSDPEPDLETVGVSSTTMNVREQAPPVRKPGSLRKKPQR